MSYARRDATELADRLKGDLEVNGYRVWLDRPEIVPGGEWEHKIVDGLRAAQLLVAVLTPSAVRRSTDPANPDAIDSVCLDEISFARFATPPTTVVPVMAQPCEPPFSIFRLDYVDMCAWRDSEERYQAGLQRLLAGIKEALGGKVTYRTQINDLQPWDFAAFLFEKRRDFCGRDWLFQEIDLWLKTNREPALLITGDPGTGKSALVAELVHRNTGGQVIAYHCCQADVLATIEPARFVRSVAAMIASQLPEYAAGLAAVKNVLKEDACAIDPFSAFEIGVLTQLQGLSAPVDGGRYLLIDALDEAVPPGASDGRGTIVDLLSRFIERLPGWLRIVATTRKEPTVLRRLAGLRAREIAAQDPRNVDDVEQYLRQQLQEPNLSQQLTDAGLSIENAVAALRSHASGNFLYATQVCTGLERGLYNLSELDTLPPGLYVSYHRFFEREFPDPAQFKALRPILEALVAADTPLTREMLARASGIDEQALSAVLRPVSAFIVHDEFGFRLFHKSLTDWLTDASRADEDFYIQSVIGKNRLADAMLATATTDLEAMPPGSQQALLRQLASIGQWERLYALIEDFSFVQGIKPEQSDRQGPHPIDYAVEWAVLYPQLIEAAADGERNRLRALPSKLVDVGIERFHHVRIEIEEMRAAGVNSDLLREHFIESVNNEWAVTMWNCAFAAVEGLVNRDPSTAPWLEEFLTDVTSRISRQDLDSLRYRAGALLPQVGGHNNDLEYCVYILERRANGAALLLDRLSTPVPDSVRDWIAALR